MESVAGEAAGRTVEDLPAAGIEVFLGYTGHDPNLKRTFFLDKRATRQDSGAVK